MSTARQTTLQRAVRWGIRLMLPIFVLAGLGGYSSLFLIGMHAEEGYRSIWSPDGKYRASVWSVHSGAACLRESVEVRVERRWGPFKPGEVAPFCFAGNPSQVEVTWFGPADLSITCHACELSTIELDEQNWGKLHYRYDVMGQ